MPAKAKANRGRQRKSKKPPTHTRSKKPLTINHLLRIRKRQHTPHNHANGEPIKPSTLRVKSIPQPSDEIGTPKPAKIGDRACKRNPPRRRRPFQKSRRQSPN